MRPQLNVRKKFLRLASLAGALLLAAAVWVGVRAQSSAPSAASPAYSPSSIDVPQRQAWGGYPYSAHLDAEIAAPDVHRMLYEDEHIRLLEVSNPPGLDVPMHGHPYPSVFVRDSGGSGGGGGMRAAGGANTVKPTTVASAAGAGGAGLSDAVLDPNSPFNGQGWGFGPPPKGLDFPSCTTSPPQAPHKPINPGAVPLHFYRVEFTRLDGEDLQTHWKEWYPSMAEPAQPATNAARPAGPNFSAQWPYPIAYDSVTAAPNNYKLLYHDDHLRLVEVTIRPGETTPMQGDPYASVLTFDSISGDPSLVTEVDLDPQSPLNGQNAGYGPPPTVFNMKVPTCKTMAPEAPRTIHNAGTVPLHYYRVDFLRIDGADFAANWRKWYPWMAYMKYMR